ncbi:hypothetical protein [Psychromonas sp. SP041]|uniref:hypothetical protein n=1 Tax=Psychromonas sp. SP041 TaxID=1365007 RepID=UPI0010C7ADE3|nr:hypothetical protein [Psychromonas sp. SP041]
MKFDQVSYPHSRAETLSVMGSYKIKEEQKLLIESSNKLASFLVKTPGFEVAESSGQRVPTINLLEARNSLVSNTRAGFQK